MTAAGQGLGTEHGSLSRRAFVAGVGAAVAVAGRPAQARARRLGNETIVGSGAHTFRVRHDFPQLPDRFTWQTTHNVAVDSAGNVIVADGRNNRVRIAHCIATPSAAPSLPRNRLQPITGVARKIPASNPAM